MKTPLVLFGTIALLFGAGFYWMRTQATAPLRSEGPPIVFGVLEDETHRVTPEMESASIAMAGQTAPDFRAIASDGRVYSRDEILAGRPLVLVFIKDGCPCSASAEPFYQRMHGAYGEAATFLGVIDGGREVAERWADRHGTPYPILADPDLEIVRAYDVWNSAYVALVTRDGQLDALWPGYSTGILREVSARLAARCGMPEAVIDVSEAPDLPYSGCPFIEEPPAEP